MPALDADVREAGLRQCYTPLLWPRAPMLPCGASVRRDSVRWRAAVKQLMEQLCRAASAKQLTRPDGGGSRCSWDAAAEGCKNSEKGRDTPQTVPAI